MPAPYEHQPHRRKVPFEIWEPVDPPTPDDPPIAAVRSPALEIVGQPFDLEPGVDLDEHPPPTKMLRDLARIDTIVSLGKPVPPKLRLALPRQSDGHRAVLPWLDRVGCMTTEQLRRAVRPAASEKWIQGVLSDLLRAGLVDRRLAQLKAGDGRRRGGSGPWLWSLTASGLRQGKTWCLPQDRTGLCAYGWLQIPEERRWRRSEARASAWLGHDLHAAEWALAVCRLAYEWRTFGVLDVLTPRYLDGQLVPPRKLAVVGARPGPASLHDVPIDFRWRFDGIASGPFVKTIKPDITLRLWAELLEDTGREFDLLVELDRTSRPAYNRNKLIAYDEFLTGWGLLCQRVQEHGRPVVIFVCRDKKRRRGLMETADRLLVGCIGHPDMPAHHWRYPGREHLLFTTEELIHHGSLLAWRLPALPPSVRRAAADDGPPEQLVTVLPTDLMPLDPPSPWGA
jgi:Replication-relaxation